MCAYLFDATVHILTSLLMGMLVKSEALRDILTSELNHIVYNADYIY
jgi:hypothetical protein